jgi:hypothetical protein
MSINNIDPNAWGPYGWKFMHYITFAYPNNPSYNDKQSMKNFFENIGNVLPCEGCRINFAKHNLIHPLTDDILSSREKLINWLIDIHNEVNKMNGKKILSYDEVYKIYSTKSDNLIISTKMAIIILIIIIFLLIMYVKCK